MVIRKYYVPSENGQGMTVKEVKVLSLYHQIYKCKHVFRRRLLSETSSGWKMVCEKCGACAR